MPYLAPVPSLAAVIARVDKLNLVEPGNRITDVSIMPEPTGAAYTFYLKLGNNPWFPVTGPMTLVLDRDAPDSDASEGLFLANAAAQAGVTVPFLISYSRDAKNVEGGVRVLP